MIIGASAATPHMSDHVVKLLAQQAAEAFADDPYHCVGPTYTHFVRSDNPMRTGRCEICRRFVCLTLKGWRTCTVAEAARWGEYGARRITHFEYWSG